MRYDAEIALTKKPHQVGASGIAHHMAGIFAAHAGMPADFKGRAVAEDAFYRYQVINARMAAVATIQRVA